MSHATKFLAITFAMTAVSAQSGAAESSAAPSISELIEHVGADSVEQFDVYSDAFALGEDILPASVLVMDGAFFADADGQGHAVLEVDYSDMVSTWVVLSESTCSGGFQSGCLGGYVVESLLTVDAFQQQGDRARLRAQVYVNDGGMYKAGSVEVSTMLSGSKLYVQTDATDADGLSVWSGSDSIELDVSEEDDFSTQGAAGKLTLGIAFGIASGAIAIVAGAPVVALTATGTGLGYWAYDSIFEDASETTEDAPEPIGDEDAGGGDCPDSEDTPSAESEDGDGTSGDDSDCPDQPGTEPDPGTDLYDDCDPEIEDCEEEDEVGDDVFDDVIGDDLVMTTF